MALNESVRRVLELAEQCTLEPDIPRELKVAVQFCIASEMACIQPVVAVVCSGDFLSQQEIDAGRIPLFHDRPIILPPHLEDAHKCPKRLLLKDKGEAAPWPRAG